MKKHFFAAAQRAFAQISSPLAADNGVIHAIDTVLMPK